MFGDRGAPGCKHPVLRVEWLPAADTDLCLPASEVEAAMAFAKPVAPRVPLVPRVVVVHKSAVRRPSWLEATWVAAVLSALSAAGPHFKHRGVAVSTLTGDAQAMAVRAMDAFRLDVTTEMMVDDCPQHAEVTVSLGVEVDDNGPKLPTLAMPVSIPSTDGDAAAAGYAVRSATTPVSAQNLPTLRVTCRVCGQLGQWVKMFVCQCSGTIYCGQACQRADWLARHRDECRRFQIANADAPVLYAVGSFSFLHKMTLGLSSGTERIDFLLRDWGLHGVGPWRRVCRCYASIPPGSLPRDDVVATADPTIVGSMDCGLSARLQPSHAVVPSHSSWGPGAAADWDDLYARLGLPAESPWAVIRHNVMTLYHVLTTLDDGNHLCLAADEEEHEGGVKGVDTTVVDYLEPTSELDDLGMFVELLRLIPDAAFHIRLVGSHVPAALHNRAMMWRGVPDAPCKDPISLLPDHMFTQSPPHLPQGTLLLTCFKGTYTEFVAACSKSKDTMPDVVVGLNAGVSASPAWIPTCQLLVRLAAASFPVFFTESTFDAAVKGAANLRALDAPEPYPVRCNPFRRPMTTLTQSRSVNIPALLNAYLYGMGFTPQPDEEEEEVVVEEEEEEEEEEEVVVEEAVEEPTAVGAEDTPAPAAAVDAVPDDADSGGVEESKTAPPPRHVVPPPRLPVKVSVSAGNAATRVSTSEAKPAEPPMPPKPAPTS